MQLSRGQRALARRFAVLGNSLPILIAVATSFHSHPPEFFVGAGLACVVPVVVNSVSRDHPVVFYTAAMGGLPALTLMQSGSGGAASGYSVLLLMPMIWFGLQATRPELITGLVVLAACAYLPMLVVGPPSYPVHWGQATILVLVGATVAGSLHALTVETLALTRRLREEATVDELTGVLNRRGWNSAAGREMVRADRSGNPRVLAILDLDRLKELNDTMGHDEGDRVLSETAERLRDVLRGGDVVARLGGDEFAGLFCGASPDDALSALARLRDCTPAEESFSAGLAVWDGEESLPELMRRADLALYEAKTNGGRRVEVAPAGVGRTVEHA